MFTDCRRIANRVLAVKNSRLKPTIPAPTLFSLSAMTVPTTMSYTVGGRSRTIIFSM